MNASLKFKLAEVEGGKEQHEMEPEKWALDRLYRVLKIMVK